MCLKSNVPEKSDVTTADNREFGLTRIQAKTPKRPDVATHCQKPDMYGQVHPMETEEFIAQKRIDFFAEIEKLPESAKASLKEAQAKCPGLLTADFQLMFLRSEVFNAQVRTDTIEAGAFRHAPLLPLRLLISL
jgi:hypothetical protein